MENEPFNINIFQNFIENEGFNINIFQKVYEWSLIYFFQILNFDFLKIFFRLV